MKSAVAAAACGIFALTALATSSSWAEGEQPTPFTRSQWIYLERCGGCHGIQGRSAPSLVPSLQGQVGYFLCIPEGREYLVRLPSIATAPISDAALADLMNFVVFDLGGPTESEHRAPRYTKEEVSALRQRPLKDAALAGYRAQLVEQVIRRCDAPESLRQYSSARSR